MVHRLALPDDPSDSPDARFAEATEPILTHHEDWPACGCEWGDCFGQKYGSDEEIKARVYARWDDPDIDPMDPMYDEDGW